VTRPAALVFCARCGKRIHEWDYVVRGGLPLHEPCWHADQEPSGPREILDVCVHQNEAQASSALEQGRGRTNVRVLHEKLRVERTWRWVWVVVADVRKHIEVEGQSIVACPNHPDQYPLGACPHCTDKDVGLANAKDPGKEGA
jgi:hypothetical protein